MRIVLIDIDSLRPDHLGCYGYSRDTSPTIDNIADQGVQFDQCYVSDSPCLPSRTAMATGRVGVRNGIVSHLGSGKWLNLYRQQGTKTPVPTAAEPLSFQLLSEEGIHTTTITSFSKRHAAYHFTASFRESIQPTIHKGAETASEVTATATDWLSRHAADDDWLLHVNYWDVHHPYNEIDTLVEEVRESGAGAEWPDQEAIDNQQGMTGPRTADMWPTAEWQEEDLATDGLVAHGDWGMPMSITDRSDAKHIIDGYDASIRKVDQAINDLLATLENEGVRDETAIIITGDHGEALGEHGIYAEHSLAHPPCQQVPLLIDWPETPGGRRIDKKIYQFDLVATLCEQLGIEIPPGWDAQSFAPALEGKEFAGRETLVCGHGIYTFSRAVYHGNWVYIRIIHPGVFSFPGLYNDESLPDYGLELLHNLEEDPHMTTNYLDQQPEVANELRSRLDSQISNWVDTENAFGRDPLVQLAHEDGPFRYLSPASMSERYAQTDRTDQQRRRVDRAQEFPLK